MVNAAGGAWRTGAGGSIDRYVQTSIEMLPGFSGGPLLGMDGRLIGMNTSAFGREGSLVIPNETLERVVRSLTAHGKVRRAYLGITSQPVRLAEEKARELGQSSGLIIIGLESGGPAEKVGVLQGDIILETRGMPTRRMEDLMAALTVDDLQATIRVKLLRGGTTREIDIQPIERD